MHLPCSFRLSADRWGKCQWREHLDNIEYERHTYGLCVCVCTLHALKVSVECCGYKGVFVKTRATPSQTAGLGVCGELKRSLRTEAPLYSFTHTHALPCTHMHTHTRRKRHIPEKESERESSRKSGEKASSNLRLYALTRPSTSVWQMVRGRESKEILVCVTVDVHVDLIQHMHLTVRWAGVKGSGLLLRDLLDFAIQLTSGCLVEFDTVGETTRLYGIQEAQSAYAVHISCVLSQVKGDLEKTEKEKGQMTCH